MDKLRPLKACRICFQNHSTLLPLLQKVKGTSTYEKLIKYTKIQIDSINMEPSSICSECLTELETTVNFLDKCEKSNQILSSLATNELTRHINAEESERQNHSTSFSTNYCKTDVESNDELYGSSAVEDMPLQELQCRSCGSKRRCKHWTPPADYKCHYCDKVFTRKFNFKLHLIRHGGERNWPCPRCGRLQLTESLALRHCAPRPQRPCPVPGCGKTFTTNTNLNTHIRSHSGERPYICNECRKGFTSKKTLNDHLRIHTGVKPYICPVCGKQFTTNKLSAHMRSHQPRGERGRAGGVGARGVGAGGVGARGVRAGGKRYSCGECPQRMPAVLRYHPTVKVKQIVPISKDEKRRSRKFY